jgi:hypothetical protein
MRLVIPFFLVLLITNCKNSKTETINEYQKFQDYIPSDSSYQYFPFNSNFLISNDLEVDSSIKQLYSEILFHLKEPSLYKGNNELKCIRILWLNARKPPMVIRVNDIDGSKYLIRKEFDSTYNGKTGNLIDTIINIDEDFWQSTFSSIDSSNFWNEKIGNPTASGKDGILWILECREGEKYHFIERWDDGTLSSIVQYPFLNKILKAIK